VVARERIHPNKYRCAGKVNTQTSPNGMQLVQKHLNNNRGKNATGVQQQKDTQHEIRNMPMF
jgi:predicted double-glycine peptidase